MGWPYAKRGHIRRKLISQKSIASLIIIIIIFKKKLKSELKLQGENNVAMKKRKFYVIFCRNENNIEK